MPENEHTLPESEEEHDLTEVSARFIDLLKRRRWWILLTACGTSLATIAVLMALPNLYTSSATLVIVQQQVPQRYVVPNSTTDVTAALDAIKQEVLSRTRLLTLINDFGLYPNRVTRLAPEQLTALMLSNIQIEPLAAQSPQKDKDFDAFKISFTTENAVLAQRVTSTLTSLFINENLRMKEEQATNTTRFLHDQVEAKKALLDQQEQRLRDFKLKYVGELPEQQQGNLSILTSLQAQLQNTITGLSRAQQQRVYLESLLSGYRRLPTVAGSVSASASQTAIRVPTPLETAQNELNRLEAEKAGRLKKHTPEHPDIQVLERQIANAEESLARLKAAPSAREPAGAPEALVPASQPASDDPAIAQIKSQLDANRLEVENFLKDERHLKAAIAQYEHRLNQTPVREQQQTGIVRETEALRLEYAELQKKEQESQLATNLEKQQGGQRFRLIDPASLPSMPSTPKRLKLSLVGAAGGLCLGFVLAFLVEKLDTSFRTEQDLARHIAVPFVLGVPAILTARDERRLRLKSVLEWLAGSVLMLVALIAEFYLYKHG